VDAASPHASTMSAPRAASDRTVDMEEVIDGRLWTLG
jgi:hypothetical protein